MDAVVEVASDAMDCEQYHVLLKGVKCCRIGSDAHSSVEAGFGGNNEALVDVQLKPDTTAPDKVVVVAKGVDGEAMRIPSERVRGAVRLGGTSVALEYAAEGASGYESMVLNFESKGEAETFVKKLRDRPAEANGAGDSTATWFDRKTAVSSADLYFHYYGMLQHQQNMLQDLNRTGTYYWAILENPADFDGKVVMDVGAGSGILSLFAAQAGASKVYAVEASGMAAYARELAAANGSIGRKLEVKHCKVEELELEEKVDVLVSEPMGTLLLNERMLETFIYARNKFLKPGGRMFPQLGRIHVAAFSDLTLWLEIASKASFWGNPAFYGVDLTSLQHQALKDYFSQVVVDAFEPSVLVSNFMTKRIDFTTLQEEDLETVTLPLQLHISRPCTVHGLACWFDVLFDGSQNQRWLSTAPGLPTTHWFQLRCCLQTPLEVAVPGTVVMGELKMVAHNRQSYDLHLSMIAPALQSGGPLQVSRATLDLKEPYYRQLNAWWAQPQLQQQQVGQQQPTAAEPEPASQQGAAANSNGTHAELQRPPPAD